MTKGNPSGLTGMGLGRWHAALRRIRVPPKELLPLGFGGLERANRDAFHGDKTLSHYVSLAMRDSQKEASIGELTFLMSAAVSNATKLAPPKLHVATNLMSTLLPNWSQHAESFVEFTYIRFVRGEVTISIST